MKRAVLSVTLLVVVVGVGLLAAGCSRKTETPPMTGPIGPKGSGVPPIPAALTYVCPDHADQKSDTPAKCPTCQKPMKADTTEPVEYFCPKHPDAAASEPGECQECGDGTLLQARVAGIASPTPPTGDVKTEPATPPTGDEGEAPAEPEKGEAGTT